MRLTVLWIVVGGVVASSCSLVVDNRAEQCTSVGGCARFPHASCDLATFTCRAVESGAVATGVPPLGGDAGARTEVEGGVPAPTGSGAASAAHALDAGCPVRESTSTLNACTDARCRPFDNRARLSRWKADAGLPPLPPPRDAGTEGQ
jgi:hypothetical protein